MFIYILRLLSRAFSDQTLEGIQKTDEDFKRDISGLRVSAVAKGVGYVLLGALIFIIIVFVVVMIIK